MAKAKVLPRPEKRKSRNAHHGTRLPTNFVNNTGKDIDTEFSAQAQLLACRFGLSPERSRLVLTLLRAGGAI